MEQPIRPHPLRYLGFVALYGFWAVAVLSRAISQYINRPNVALPTHLSLVAGLIYLAISYWAWKGDIRRVRLGLWVECCGVILVSIGESFVPMPYASAWSHFGSGYLWLPLILPVAGIILSFRQTHTAATPGV